MIVYGTRRVPQLQQVSPPVQCPHCLQHAPVLVVGCVQYVHIFWIPLFATKTAVYLCSDCRKPLVDRFSPYRGNIGVAIPQEAKRVYESIKPQIKKSWYHFLWLILLAGFVLFAMLQR